MRYFRRVFLRAFVFGFSTHWSVTVALQGGRPSALGVAVVVIAGSAVGGGAASVAGSAGGVRAGVGGCIDG
jgi:hypothetical protein